MLTRRQFATSAAAAATMASSKALAAIACSQYNYQGIQQCTAGLQIGPIPTAQQQCANWCWAACIQAIFSLHGYRVPQEQIVAKLFGSLQCLPATGPQIIHTVNGIWQSDDGTQFTAQAYPLLDLQFGVFAPNAAAQAAVELANNKPLINGALGHATVMTAMTYLRDQYSRGMPIQIVVRDPWPGSPNRRVLSPQEAMGTFFLARVDVF